MYVINGDGRLSEVSMAGRPIVSYDWSAAPYAVPMRFFNRWSVVTAVLPDGSAMQQVVDSRGAQRAFGSVLAHGHEFGRPSALLDAYAADLGLAAGWQEGMQTTSANDVRLQANGKAIAIRFRQIGEGVRVAEADAKPILWDIDLPLAVDGRLGQVVPSRLIVTSSGAVQLSGDTPPSAACSCSRHAKRRSPRRRPYTAVDITARSISLCVYNFCVALFKTSLPSTGNHQEET